MGILFQPKLGSRMASYKKNAMTSICLLPIAAMLPMTAHAQLTNVATVTGTPDAGVLTDITATESVTVVRPVEGASETFPAINGADGGVTGSVLASDTINGVAVNPDDVTITVGASDPELTLDPATGLITVAAGTPAGTYTVEYTICEDLNPTNCATVTETVVVEAAPVAAAAETFPTINGADGGVTTSVLASDMLNGVAVNPDDVTLTVGASDPELTLDPATGLITVAPGTPAGTYTVEYTICEDLNPTNCATVVEEVTVGEAPIAAAPEVFPTINGADGGVTTSVLASDMLNGVAVNPDDVTLTVGASDPELTLDPDTGLITVAAGTAAGTYTVEYTVCENLNPTNCATVTETVVVEAAPVAAAAETFPAINGADGGVTTSVLAGDMLNGVAVNPDDVTLTVGASDPELTLDPATGLITVAPGTPAGTYTVEYTICEDLNPTNCATVVEEVTVGEAPIAAAPEVFPTINGADGGVTTSVLASDMLNGVAVNPDDVTLTVGASDPELTLDPATGLITVAPGTPAGTYTVEYTICEDLNPTNCATVVEEVTVGEAPIAAAPESFPTINGADGGVTTSVLASDMLNGVAVNPDDVTLTVGTSDPELTLDPTTGLITVAAGTPAGTYTVEYTVCEDLNPTNCATVTETVVVEAAPIAAAAETFPAINGADGGVTTSVLAGDMLNGVPVNPDDVTLTVGVSDPELTLDPDTGLITIAPGTPAGTYTVEYTVCEDLNPTNCATVTETVVVEAAPVAAAAETFPAINGADGGVTTSVLAGDMLNGVPVNPDDVTLTVGVSDPELTLDPDTGLITIAPGTPAGTYTVEYTVCEDLNPTNCATVTETVVVEAAPVAAAAETFPAINGADGGVTTSVLAGDMLNGDPVNAADVTLTVGASDPELTLDPDTGLITVAAGTAAGTYTVEYTVCENLNPTNCATVTETVVVEAAPVAATAETFPAINGADGGVTTSVLASDMLNGVAVNPDDVTLTVGTSDPELTLDPATGLITVAAGTPAGTYTVEYTICEDLNPTNCATVVETVVVGEAPIAAAPESFPTINGADGGVTTSVLASDMLNGVAVNPDDVTLTVGTSDPELTLDPATGLITVAAGTPAGTYTVEYTICEDLNPTNCASVVETVVVGEAPIAAAPESFPTINGADGGVTTSVLASDMLNGVAVNPDDVTLTVGTSDPELMLDPDTGLITVAAGTPAGTYTVEYTVCEDLNPTNCATVVETVVVGEAPIAAAPESFPTINGADGGVTTSVLASDMLNGVAVNPDDVTLTVGTSDPELTLDPATGLITVAAGTPAGTYTVEYTICEDLNPTNCASVVETVVVGEAPIAAAPESFPTINGADGGVTTSVLASDMLNGVAVNPDDVTLTVGTSDPELMLDPATGLITVAAGTPAGTYTVEYTVCEDLNPTNCATVVETVVVGEAPIAAAPESFPTINGADGGVTTSVLASDMLNGVAVNPDDVTLTVGTSDPELTLDPATGLITVAAGTPAGTYTVEYTICEDLNPTNCASVVETVVVGEAPIAAAPESFPTINGADGGVTTSVLASDMLNGVAVNPDDVTLTVGTSDPELTLDPATGLITVAAGTPAGTYTVEYTVCEDLNPTNCASVVETVVVGEAPIAAAPESFPTINGADGGVTTSVLASDMLNGVAVNPDDVTLTVGTSDPELTLDPATGLITVAAGTPAGTYTVEYTICEDLNPTNCASVVETVVVGEAPIAAAPESFPTINGADGGVTTSVLASDMLNGVAVNPDDVTLTVGTSDPELMLDPATGLITVAAGTPAGTYTVEYTVCEDLNPTNCATVVETVVVGEAPIAAAPESFPTINGADGGVTTSVLASDMLNGVAVNPDDVTLTVGTSDPELTLDPATGLITVAAGTPAGTYTVEYTICEDLNPTNCASVVETVVVGEAPIAAAPESFPTINGADGGVTTSVLASDMLNGVAVNPDDVTLTVGTSDPELTLDPATGLITVAAGTPAGTYTVEYTVCEDLNPTNCASVVETVVVGEAPIAAAPESFPTINGADGGVTTSVLASDMLNGVAVNPDDVTLTVGTSDPELTLDPATGLITVAAGTPAGTYTVEYTVCEDLNPTNCATVVETVVVGEAPIAAAPESFPTINGADGGVTTSVLASDMLNGVAVNPDDVTLTVGASDDELTLDPTTGLITVAPGTPAGTYTVAYEICETLNPTNCATVVETVVVGEAPIISEPEAFPAINGANGGVTTSVLASDMLNGVAVNPDDVTLTVGASDPELTLDPDTGLITVAAGTPAGTYTVEYTICEDLNPTNCASVLETVTIEEAVIAASPDSVSGIDSTDGGQNVVNVLGGDTLNGVEASIDTVAVSVAPGFTLPEGFTLNPDGSIDVAPGTADGEYVIEYQICEILNPTNCTTSTVTVGVEPSSALLSGVVYMDSNNNNEPDANETLFAGWVVEVRDSRGNVVASVITDENGHYETELPFGEFEVSFVNPDNGAVFGTSTIDVNANSKLPSGELSVVVNLPIDPSGVVYDAVTRVPVQGTLLTLVDSNNQPLPPLCFIDPSQQDQTTDSDGFYRFDIVPGADIACPVGQTDYRIVFDAPESHLDTNSTIIGAQPGFLASDAGTGPLLVVEGAGAPQEGEDTTHYFGFTLGAGSRNVINNHIPLDPITFVRSPIDVVKSTPRRDVNFGDLVPYTITVTNTEDLPRIDLDIIDFIPPGFKFVEDSSRLNGEAVVPEVSGRNIILNDFDFEANETMTWTMLLVVGAGAGDGIFTNQAFIRDTNGEEISNRAEAVVRVSPDPLFDCSELIGKVFDDKDKDGYQDEGEPGMAGVRLATAKGLLVTTDQHGRYHIACAAIPNSQIGSNFILKLDDRTLPTGYHLTSENPRVVRLTRGKLSKANFGTALENIITLDVTDAAFETGSNTLRPEFSSQLGQIIDALKGQESTLNLTYYASAYGREDRITELGHQIQELWKIHGDDYDLNIDRKTIWSGDTNISKTGGEE